MTVDLKDIEILLAEDLFEEAERHLMAFLSAHPNDAKALEYLTRVERALHLSRSLEVRLPSKEEALRELRRVARISETQNITDDEELKTWFLREAPVELLVDLTVVMGAAGWMDRWAEVIEGVAARGAESASRAEAYGWMARFYSEDGQALRSRQWAEKALSALALHHAEAPTLWKQLRVLHAKVLWSCGDRQLSVAQLTDLAKQLSGDQEIRLLLESYQRQI